MMLIVQPVQSGRNEVNRGMSVSHLLAQQIQQQVVLPCRVGTFRFLTLFGSHLLSEAAEER
jgi:hypothetical protein